MITLDASVIVALYLEESEFAYAAASLASSEGSYAPGNVYGEVAQALLRAERVNWMGREQVDASARAVEALRIAIVSSRLNDILALARKHAISAYDAMYLAVAIEYRAPLATLDATLREAARAERVEWVPATLSS